MGIRQIAFFGMVAGAVALGLALASQAFLGLVPCALCYLERWPYRLAIGIGFLGLLVPARLAQAAAWLLVPVYAGAAGLAFVHVGVEQHWWKSPLPECTAPDLRGLNAAQKLTQLPDRPFKSCEDPDYPLAFIPVTMAQGNLLYALAAGAGLTMLLVGQTRRR